MFADVPQMETTMIENLEGFKIAVIGGGRRCKLLLQSIFSEDAAEKRPDILGVADKNSQATGLQYAQQKGIFTTSDYRELLSIEDLDLILELTPDDSLKEIIREAKPPGVLFVDHYQARAILDSLQINAKKTEILNKIRTSPGDLQRVETLFKEFYSFVLEINRAANTFARETRESLVASEWVMSQIINGSTIPTFVIDKNHQVTHWNKACEKLTGYAAGEMVGTDHQWKPFRSQKRPTMADLILDEVTEEELWRLYGTRWERSALISNAYEVEEFFPHLGQEGTWLFFTAVPIVAPDGAVAGAIETLWDLTKQKQAEEERERKNRELARKVEEVSAKEQMMSQIINGSTIPTFVIDKDHTLTHWNKALERLTGVAASEMIGTRRQWAPFYDHERASMADVVLDQTDAQQIWKLYGSRWRHSAFIDGAYESEAFFPNLGEGGKWCWFTAAPIKTPEGETVGAIETIWDKTEERKVEKEREQHTKELATFCSIYATLSGALSLEGRIRAAIEEVANIFLLDGICIFIVKPDGAYHLRYSYGYSENLCFRDRVADAQSMVVHVARSGKMSVLNELPDSEGDEIGLLRQEGLQSLLYIPILDKGKKGVGVVRAASRKRNHFDPNDVRAMELIVNRIGVAIENYLLEEDVRRKASFQAKLIGSSNDGIVATDDQWNVVIFNPAAETIFGYAASDVVGKMNARTIYPEPIFRAFDEVLASRTATWNLPWNETAILSKDDVSIPVRFSGTILREKHKMMGIVAYFQDLREIKRLEKELLGAERLAAVGQTVAGMAHCVKNILHGLKGGSYLVNVGIGKDNPEKLKTGWQMVQRNIERTSDLVQDLLSYSKEREPEYALCSPNKIAAEVCELMREVAQKQNVQFVEDLSPEIGEVVMDGRSLHRALMNLISNAIDACRDDPNPGKEHRISLTTALEEGCVIRFEVQDNGSGMSDEVKEKLFSSLFSTKGPQGTGLGLLVTRKLIEENNGSIDVESQLGEGTTFSMRLPFKKE
jgi:PAS domain S-box-containing protein